MTQESLADQLLAKIVNGAYFSQLQNVAGYQASLPLYYTMNLPDTESEYSFQLSINDCMRTLNNRSTEFEKQECKVDTALTEISKALHSHIERLENSIEADGNNMFEISSKQQTKLTRGRRGIHFLGQILEFCCDVAIKSTSGDLMMDRQAYMEQIETLNTNFHNQYSFMSDLTNSVNKYQEDTDKNLHTIGNRLSTIHDIVNKIGLLSTHDSRQLAKTSKYIAWLFTEQFKTIKVLERQDIINSCKQKHIPSFLIPASVLSTDLKKLQETLEKEDYKITIPLNNISRYYTLPIAECVLTKADILVKIQVPVASINSDWKFYNMITIPFAWKKDSTCILSHDTTIVAVNNITITPITGRLLATCDPVVDKLCYIPRFTSDTLFSTSCPNLLYKGATIEEINNNCYLHCQRNDRLQVTQINFETFIFTHIKHTLKITCNNKSISYKIDKIQSGSIQVKVSCDCDITIDDLNIPAQFPCIKNAYTKPIVEHILPSIWSNKELNDLKVSQFDEEQATLFSSEANIINDNWTLITPHINLTMPDVPRYLNDYLPNDMGYVQTASYNVSFMWSITITIILSILIFKNPHLLFPVAFPQPATALDGPISILVPNIIIIITNTTLLALTFIALLVYFVKKRRSVYTPVTQKEAEEASADGDDGKDQTPLQAEIIGSTEEQMEDKQIVGGPEPSQRRVLYITQDTGATISIQ